MCCCESASSNNGVLLSGVIPSTGGGTAGTQGTPGLSEAGFLNDFANLPWWAQLLIGAAIVGSAVWSISEIKKGGANGSRN